MKKRIWELDALRGLCILGMLAVHFIFDAVELYGLVQWQYGPVFVLLKDWGGIAFILLSGICVTLGSHCVSRGLLVFACGMLCTAVTLGMYALGLADRSILIWFGILHCLGSCMVLWKPLGKLPVGWLALLGVAFASVGLWLTYRVRVSFDWLCPLGLYSLDFVTADYYPLLPYLGFFLLGAVLGRTVYRQKQTLLPQVNENSLPLGFLRFCGRHSLMIYLVHQPVFSGLLWAISTQA